jgi:acyl-coenzyme A synthetase/AMP-(fatty) acid ligase
VRSGLKELVMPLGDLIRCYMPSSIELLEAYYATSKAGAVTNVGSHRQH